MRARCGGRGRRPSTGTSRVEQWAFGAAVCILHRPRFAARAPCAPDTILCFTPAPAERPGPHSPKEVTELNSYELMLILRPDTVDEARAAILDRIKEIVAADQGVMGKIDEWGKRRFAYEIAHMTEGYYYVMYFNVEPKTLDEITRVLGITDAVVRNMPVRLEDPVAPVAAVAAVAATTTEE